MTVRITPDALLPCTIAALKLRFAEAVLAPSSNSVWVAATRNDFFFWFAHEAAATQRQTQTFLLSLTGDRSIGWVELLGETCDAINATDNAALVQADRYMLPRWGGSLAGSWAPPRSVKIQPNHIDLATHGELRLIDQATTVASVICDHVNRDLKPGEAVR